MVDDDNPLEGDTDLVLINLGDELFDRILFTVGVLTEVGCCGCGCLICRNGVTISFST